MLYDAFMRSKEKISQKKPDKGFNKKEAQAVQGYLYITYLEK